MRREIDVDAPLDVLREGAPMQVTLRPGPFPLELPKLPGPPKVGSTAPPLDVEMVTRDDGDDAMHEAAVKAKDRPRLLYFWATWCTICKQALPELHAFTLARSVDVIAITDEEPDLVREFLRTADGWFPPIVVTDPFRATFQSYGVSGTPTFVLIDGAGVVRQYQSGYRPELGLQIDGWKSSKAEPHAHQWGVLSLRGIEKDNASAVLSYGRHRTGALLNAGRGPDPHESVTILRRKARRAYRSCDADVY